MQWVSDSSVKQIILDPSTTFAVDLTAESDRLIIQFGGGLGGVGMPIEDFIEAFLAVNSKRVFMRDTLQMYYLFGVPGLGDSIEQLAAWTRRLIEIEKTSHVTMFGNCMGGHIAILLGLMLDADVVHAFYPKTSIKWYHRLLYQDRPPAYLRRDMMFRTNFGRRDHWKYLDLRSQMRKYPDFHGVINIYASPDKPLTMLHANRLAEFSQVVIHTDKFNQVEILNQQ